MAKKKELTSQYIKRVYGLELNDFDLTEADTKAEVDRIARKFDIEKVEVAMRTMTPEKAMAILRPFMK